MDSQAGDIVSFDLIKQQIMEQCRPQSEQPMDSVPIQNTFLNINQSNQPVYVKSLSMPEGLHRHHDTPQFHGGKISRQVDALFFKPVHSTLKGNLPGNGGLGDIPELHTSPIGNSLYFHSSPNAAETPSTASKTPPSSYALNLFEEKGGMYTDNEQLQSMANPLEYLTLKDRQQGGLTSLEYPLIPMTMKLHEAAKNSPLDLAGAFALEASAAKDEWDTESSQWLESFRQMKDTLLHLSTLDSLEACGLAPPSSMAQPLAEARDNAEVKNSLTETELTPEMLAKIPTDQNGNILSYGSIAHAEGTCKACVFFHNPSKGCKNGVYCLFCHFPHAPKKRVRLSKKKRAGEKMANASPSPKGYDSHAYSAAVPHFPSQSDYSPAHTDQNFYCAHQYEGRNVSQRDQRRFGPSSSPMSHYSALDYAIRQNSGSLSEGFRGQLSFAGSSTGLTPILAASPDCVPDRQQWTTCFDKKELWSPMFKPSGQDAAQQVKLTVGNAFPEVMVTDPLEFFRPLGQDTFRLDTKHSLQEPLSAAPSLSWMSSGGSVTGLVHSEPSTLPSESAGTSGL